METLHGLVDTQANLIDSLTDRVRCLENRRERRGRSSGRSTHPPSSSGALSYGSNPVPIPVPPPRGVEGLLGMVLVSVLILMLSLIT